LRAQGTLIADFQFLELAQMPAPPDNVPANVRRFYQQNRAWGKVMTGQAGDAKVLFDEALQLFGTERESLEYLYLSNIRALSLLKSGDLIAALAAELEIGAVLQQSSRPDQRLLYVNSLNTARAYRNLGDYENAEVFIRKAFDTTYGVRSAPDLIYLNLYLGKIYSASGRHADALDSFIRAAIHWIVYSPPEALPARVLGLINGAVPTFQNCAQETANSWMRTLQVAAKNLGIVVTEKFNGSGPAFVSVDQLTKEQSKTLIRGVGIPGLGFILSDLKMDGVSRSPEFTILASFLANLLEARIPELSDGLSIVVDHRLGCDIPSTATELLESCMRLDVPEVLFSRLHLELKPSLRGQVLASMKVRVGPPVERITFDKDAATIYFKRYLSPLTLSLKQSRLLLEMVSGEASDNLVADEDNRARLWQELRELEQLRVVECFVPVTFLDDFALQTTGERGA
jgi:tetratricopeptide (TPR) repeat protein